MKEYSDVFAEDVEIPDIVLQKAGDAFAVIKTEGNRNMNNNNNYVNKKRTRLFKSQTAAAACAGILILGSITAAASIHHFWSKGMQGTIQATDKQQQTLTDQGVASVLNGSEKDLSVTHGNITVTPETVIADDKFAHISFSVKGYTVSKNMEPAFEFTNAYLGDDPDDMNSWVNSWSSFYDGIVTDENGDPVYDDGTPLQTNKNGNLITHYTDENGNLEYVVTISTTKNDLLGKTLHVDLQNIGTVSKAEYTNVTDGNWNFTIDLPETSSAVNIQVGQAVSGTDFVMDTIDISPISIKINYTVNGKVTVYEDDNGVPEFCGVVLKDGTRLLYIGNGGNSGYTDDTMRKAYLRSAFNRVIEPDQVASVLVSPELGSADIIEIPIDN